MGRVLLIFIDGLGLGDDDPQINPLVRYDPPFFRKMFGLSLTRQAAPYISDRLCLVATDACLGIDGLPQSATGQTSLFTGVNAARVMGRHILGFPGPQLAQIIAENGLMRQLAAEGYSVTSANMYSPNYFDLVASRKRRHSASTLTILGAGLKLRSLAEMAAGEAVYQDITNESLPLLGIADVPAVSPAVAGERLAVLAGRHHFTLFEYFQTDRQGHKRDWNAAEKIITDLNEFLAAVHRTAGEMLVLVTSDHGNFEDFGVKTHTKNLVPTLIWGPGSRGAAGQVASLTDIKPLIINYLRKGGAVD